MQENLTQNEQIVVKVLSKMASESGKARSEDLLFIEVLKTHREFSSKQTEIREAIFSLIQKGIIIHDEKIPMWIRLNR